MSPIVIGIAVVAYLIIGVTNMMMSSYVDGCGGRKGSPVWMDFVRILLGLLYIVPTLASYAHVKGAARRLEVNK